MYGPSIHSIKGLGCQSLFRPGLVPGAQCPVPGAQTKLHLAQQVVLLIQVLWLLDPALGALTRMASQDPCLDTTLCCSSQALFFCGMLVGPTYISLKVVNPLEAAKCLLMPPCNSISQCTYTLSHHHTVWQTGLVDSSYKAVPVWRPCIRAQCGGPVYVHIRHDTCQAGRLYGHV